MWLFCPLIVQPHPHEDDAMPHTTSLITTIAAGLGLAMILGFLATRLRMPPLVIWDIS